MQHLPGNGEIANRFLGALPPSTLDRIRLALEPVALERGQTIGRVNHRIEHLYLINRGLVSLVKSMRDGRTVEIGAVGIEGVTDPNVLCGIDRTVLEAVVQVPGSALRIRVDPLRQIMRHDAALQSLMQHYVRFTFAQLAQTAACNRLHLLEERCCRWLLIAHDSAGSDTFPLTHEFLAMMLGVQRAGVSTAANFLRKAGLISYTHGVVTVTDRRGLERMACECHSHHHGGVARGVFQHRSAAASVIPPNRQDVGLRRVHHLVTRTFRRSV